MSLSSMTKVALEAELEIAKKAYRVECDAKVASYQSLQTSMGQRLAPLLEARNQAFPQLIASEGEVSVHAWKMASSAVGKAYDNAELELAETMLAHAEACNQAARRVLDIQKAIAQKEEDYKNWSQWSDSGLIQRFEVGDLDYSVFITKSAEHTRNVDKLFNAYKTTQPDLHAPTREVIRRAAFEVYGEACKTPLDSIHWPRHRDEAGNNSDVTLASETGVAKLYEKVDPHSTHGPGGFMTRKFVANKEVLDNMRLKVPETKAFNVASWLQATPDLAIEAALLRDFDPSS